MSMESRGEYDEIKNTMLRFARAMYIAGRPDLERKEYAKKLYKLISPGAQDDALKLFSEYSAGTIDKEQLKNKWAEAVLQSQQPKTKPVTQWEVYRDDHGQDERLEIVNATTRGEAVDAVYDTYTGVIPFKVRPYSGEPEPAPKLSRRAEIAKRIKEPKVSPAVAADNAQDSQQIQARIGEPQPAGGIDDWSAEFQRRVQDIEPDVTQNFGSTPGSTPWRDQLAQTIRDSAPRANFELYLHDQPNSVFHSMDNATADEVRDYIEQQEQGGMPPGFLRARQVA